MTATRAIARLGLVSRRELLALALGGGASALLAGCGLPSSWRRWGPQPAGGIDLHCHIFNANDLPIRGFAENVVLRGQFGVLRGVLRAFQWVLQTPAPGFDEERRLLTGLIDGEEASTELLEELEPPEGLLEDSLERLESEDPEAFRELYESEGLDPSIEADGALLGTVFERALHWAWMLTRYRAQVAKALSDSYPEIALFTPALVDLELWVEADGQVKTPIARQAELYRLISQWSGGRFHGFFGFDPLRDLTAPDGPGGTLDNLKQAVARQGFIGVKLYPPMGFQPLGNHGLWPPGDRRARLDERLHALYAWCQEQDVPILAHCNDSNGSEPRFGSRASPQHWALVLAQYPNLRLCLGHFGGVAGLRRNPESSWAWQIGGLMQRFPNVYADTGFHDVALDADDGDRRRYFDALERLVDEFSEARDRLVYGSDWQMILISKGNSRYAAVYREQMEARFGSGTARAFWTDNALRALGLAERNAGNRRRLGAFYAAAQIPNPPWWPA